jgi:hypothetical protein
LGVCFNFYVTSFGNSIKLLLQVYPEQFEGRILSFCKTSSSYPSPVRGEGGQAIKYFSSLVLTLHPKNFIHHVLCIIKKNDCSSGAVRCSLSGSAGEGKGEVNA